MTREEAIRILKREASIGCQEKWQKALDMAIKALRSEITEEDVKVYCEKRNLVVLTQELFNELSSRGGYKNGL